MHSPILSYNYACSEFSQETARDGGILPEPDLSESLALPVVMGLFDHWNLGGSATGEMGTSFHPLPFFLMNPSDHCSQFLALLSPRNIFSDQERMSTG